jgi:signal transduction histidine kinase
VTGVEFDSVLTAQAQEQEQEQAAYTHAACALLTCTMNGQLLQCNDTLLHWIRADAATRPELLHGLFTPASVLFFEMQLRPLLALGRDVEGAFVALRHRDGSSVPVVLNARRSPNAETLELAMLVVREREQYEASLRQSSAEAERALAAMSASAHAQKMQAVGQMAGGIAHEFNNLLAVVRGNITFAQQGVRLALPADAGIAADLHGAVEATDRAVAIVRQLLAFTGRQVARRALLDVNIVVHDAAQLLVPALGRDITWQTRLSEAPWPVYAPADQLQHALTSLVLNARDAVRTRGEPGIVRVTTENVSGSTTQPDRVCITVEDSGTGMTDDVRARAFDPFFTTKDVGQGMGLGLSMVYGTIEALGGHTAIASTPGEGTRVTMTLPRAAAPSSTSAPGTQHRHSG